MTTLAAPMLDSMTTLQTSDLSVADAARWQAVLDRDAAQDGHFVYAVVTTGVYCRPTCPSRRPRRENVRFFDGPAAAESAGFRECRRCYPKRQPAAERLVAETMRLIDGCTDETTPDLSTLAASLGVSAGYLQRRFKRSTGLSPHAYAASRRSEALKSRLREGDDVTTATYEAGYGSISRVYEGASSLLGMTPATYKHGGRGLTIGWTTTATRFGRVLVAATERGLCFVALADDDEALEAKVRTEFPAATIGRDDAAMSPYVEGLHAYLDSGLRTLDLHIDAHGSLFQMLVWRALQSIPAGETRSYGEVAKAIGHPRAVRAVANACAHNPTALVVPCHRVVPATGAPGGYRWGVERKQALIEHEAAASA